MMHGTNTPADASPHRGDASAGGTDEAASLGSYYYDPRDTTSILREYLTHTFK